MLRNVGQVRGENPYVVATGIGVGRTACRGWDALFSLGVVRVDCLGPAVVEDMVVLGTPPKGGRATREHPMLRSLNERYFIHRR